MSSPTGVGVAGLGRIGAVHARNIAERTIDARLVHVLDARADVACETSKRFATRWSTDRHEFLADPDLEAVVVATPTATHAPLIAAAIAAGKHVLCEKPVTQDVAGTSELVRMARSAGVLLQVGFQMRYDLDFATLKPRVQAGELGEIHFVHASLRDMCPPGPAYLRSSGGFFLDGAIHLLDLVSWLVGDIDEVTAFGSTPRHPTVTDLGDVDNTAIVVRFETGALGVLENSRTAGYGFEARAELMGSRRTVRVANHHRTHLEWREPGSVSRDHITDFLERWPDAYLAEMLAFVAAVRGGPPPRATGDDAVTAATLALAARRSFLEARTVRVAELASRSLGASAEDAPSGTEQTC